MCPQPLGCDTFQRPPDESDHLVEPRLGAEVEPPVPGDEIVEVVDGGVAEDLGRPVGVGARNPLAEVGHQSHELLEEHLVGQADGLLEPGLDAELLQLMDGGREPDQMGGGLEIGEIPAHREAAQQGRRIVGRLEERTEPSSGIGLELIEVPLQTGGGVTQARPSSRPSVG